MKKKIFFYLQLATSLILVTFFAFTVDISSIHSISDFGWIYILLVFILANLDRILMAYKWDILLKVKGIAIPFSSVIKSYYVGTFWATFLPASVSGDIVRGFRISGETKKTEDIISSIVVERVLGMVSAFIIGILSAALFTLYITPQNWKILIGVLLSFCLFLGILTISFSTSLNQWLALWFQSREWSLLNSLTKIYHSYRTFQHHRGPLLRFLLWSLLEQSIPVFSFFLVSKALSIDLPFLIFMIFVPLILSLSRLPISLDGFGVREGLFVYFFSFVGLSSSDAFQLGFLSHIIGNISILPGFFYFSFYSTPPIGNREQFISSN